MSRPLSNLRAPSRRCVEFSRRTAGRYEEIDRSPAAELEALDTVFAKGAAASERYAAGGVAIVNR